MIWKTSLLAVVASALIVGGSDFDTGSAASGGAPEMAVSLQSGGGCSLTEPVCYVPTGDVFVLSVDAVAIPDEGYVEARAWISYGDDLGNQANNGQPKSGVLDVWPDCGMFVTSYSDEAGNSNIDSFSTRCRTGLIDPPPSSYVGSLYTFSLTCTATESANVIELIALGDSPAGADGAKFVEPGEVDVVPKVSDLTIICGEETTDSDGDGCADLREIGSDETLGGLRDPTNEHDFYNLPGLLGEPPDGIIDLSNDILGVVQHYAPTGVEPAYDVVFDRGPTAGPNPWNMTAPDGVIDLSNDILGVVYQYLHDCR